MTSIDKQNTFRAEGVGGPIHVLEKSNVKTAFGELLVAQLSPIFQNSFEYTVSNTALNKNTTVNGGTVTQATAMAVVGTSTTTASSAELKSETHAKYRAGMGGVLRFTSLFTSPVAVTEQYVGIMDEAGSSQAFKNGYGVGHNGTTFGFHRWSNDTLTTVAQSDWDDPLNGSGPSGMVIDFTKINVYFIQFQYLGGGAISLYIEDDKTGQVTEVHKILYANFNTEPSVYNPNFHFHIWVDNKATTSDLIVKSSSYGYFVEGRTNLIELQQPQQSSGLKQKTDVTTEVAILTIRNKTSYASKSNFIEILLENVSGAIEASAANNLGKLRIIKNATLGGTPSYSDINTTNSVVDIDTAGTTVSGGTELLSFPLAGKNDKFSENIIPYRFILGDGDTLTIAGTSANSATIEASILWRELF